MKSNPYYEMYLDLVKAGELGLNRGIPFRSKMLTKALGGITRQTYYVLLAESNVGKTRLATDLFWLTPIEFSYSGQWLDPGDVKVFYFAYEVPIPKLIAMANARYNAINLDKWYSDSQLIGKENVPTADMLKTARSKEFREYVNTLQKHTTFFTEKKPEVLYRAVEKYCKSVSSIAFTDELGKHIYKFNNPNQYVIVIIDHLSNISTSEGHIERNAIQKMSKSLFELRNKYGITILALQQANPSFEKHLIPAHENSRDSKDPFIDADVFFGVGSPYKQGIAEVSYKGGIYYIIPQPESRNIGLKDTIRFIGVRKRRYGGINPLVPVKFHGGVSLIEDMPPPDKVIYK